MRTKAILPLALLAGSIATGASAQGSGCPGPLPQQHRLGEFNFDTNSRQQATKVDGFKSEIVSCVMNYDKQYPLHVDWLIPGPHGWAPPANILESVARQIADERVRPYPGCLSYGNRGDADQGQFLGTGADEEKVKDEKDRGCRAASARSTEAGPSGPIRLIRLVFRNFFPSDVTRPRETLMQMDGTVQVLPQTSSSYSSVITYTMRRYEGSEGNATDITFRPAFRDDARPLLSAFNRRNDGAVKGSVEGRIAFDVPEISNPRLVYSSYDVLDRAGNVVAAIDFPLFVSAR
jgi:hypothetical protein